MNIKTALMITNKSENLTGIITPIDENNVNIEWENEIVEILSSDDFDSLLENENFVLEEVELDEDTPAQASIQAHKTADVAPGDQADGNPKTRLDMIRAILGGLADVDTETLTRYFNDQQAMIGGEGERAGLGNVAGKNAASIQMHPSAAMESVIPKLQKEEQDALFSESTLTEETKKKMSTLFESAVISRVTEEVVKIQEVYDNKLNEAVENITENLIEQIDTYITHAAEEWLKENEVAVESSLRNDLVSEFLDKLQELFTEHYIDVPEEKVNVIEKLVKENEELNEKLNKKINEEIEVQKTIKAFKKNEIVNSLGEGLTLPQKEKLKKLAETVDFESEEVFKEKVNTLKEGFIKEKNRDSNIINEKLEVVDENKGKLSQDPRINKIAELINNVKV